MKKMKKTNILIIAGIISLIVGVVFDLFFHIPLNQSKNFCNMLSGEIRLVCRNSYVDCSKISDKIGLWSCMAIQLINYDVDAAQKACKQLDIPNDQKFCFADALDEIDIKTAEEQCELIDASETKIMCKANIYKKINLTRSLNFCEEFNESDKVYLCKAIVTTPTNANEAYEWCKKINDVVMKNKCINSVR